MLKRIFVTVLCFYGLVSSAQKTTTNKITLPDLWASPKYFAKPSGEYFFSADGKGFFSADNEAGQINYSEFSKPKSVKPIIPVKSLKADSNLGDFDDYLNPSAGNKFLLYYETEPIYRYSTRQVVKALDVLSGSVYSVFEGKKVSNALVAPNSQMVSFVFDNDLYFQDLEKNVVNRVTDNGKFNHIINGAADWVYEEEFELVRAYEWSTRADKLIYLQFNESQVRQYKMQTWPADSLYPTEYAFKYPKAGEANSEVSLWVYDVKTNKSVAVEVPGRPHYIPRIYATPNDSLFLVYGFNRLQNQFIIFSLNIYSGKINQIYKEESDTWVDLPKAKPYFIGKTKFVITSDYNGYNQLLMVDLTARSEAQKITQLTYDADEILGITTDGLKIYFSAYAPRPRDLNVFCFDTKTKLVSMVTPGIGHYDGKLSPSGQYLLVTSSGILSPPRVDLYSLAKKITHTQWHRNTDLEAQLNDVQLGTFKWQRFKGASDDSLEGYFVYPPDFDASKKYPVLIHVYGGPGSQQVADKWQGHNFLWHQMLATNGYIVAVFDGRGTGGRGTKFRKQIYKQMGKYEAEDVISVAKDLAKLNFIDAKRIGVWGWSFGGYLSSLATFLGGDIFKACIAVAPVTHWRFYDSIYTERYLGLPTDNAKGYDGNSPITYAKGLKSEYLLIHGTADDNVHFQNAVQLQRALIGANKQFASFYYPDKNHGIYGGITRYHLFKQMTDFLILNL